VSNRNVATINASTGQIIDASDLGRTISTSNNPRLIICCEVQFPASGRQKRGGRYYACIRE
jgi:hypothetical protein